VEIPGLRAYNEFRSSDHIDREIRVWAIQWHIQQYIEKPVTFDKLGRVGYWLPDIFRLKKRGLKSTLDRGTVTSWFAEAIERESESHTIEGILEELERRRSIIASRK